jgi:hypothetical protein
VDFAVIKDWLIAGDTHIYGRLDVLNAFNYKNYVDVLTTWPTYFPIEYNTTGNITGVPRTFKFSMGVRW